MKFVLDKKKWICGRPNQADRVEGNYLGKGHTRLENDEGFRCCLGQFIKQVKPDADIIHRGSPDELEIIVPPFSDFHTGTFSISDTPLSGLLMFINDNSETTVEEKIESIRERLKGYGHELEVVE